MNEETNVPNNAEIDKALKDFEAKNSQQAPKAPEASKVSSASSQNEVEGVSFEVPSYRAVKYYAETDTPKVIKLAMKWSGGLIKGERQAEYVLFAFVIIMMAVSFYLFFGGGIASKTLPEDFVDHSLDF